MHIAYHLGFMISSAIKTMSFAVIRNSNRVNCFVRIDFCYELGHSNWNTVNLLSGSGVC